MGRWELSPNQGRFVLDWAGLLSRSDQDDLLWDLRQLFDDTAGKAPMFVATTRGLPPEFSGANALQAYRRDLFDRLHLPADNRGLLLLFYNEPGAAQVSLEFGPGWTEADQTHARNTLQTALAATTPPGNPIVNAAADLAKLVVGAAAAPPK